MQKRDYYAVGFFSCCLSPIILLAVSSRLVWKRFSSTQPPLHLRMIFQLKLIVVGLAAKTEAYNSMENEIMMLHLIVIV